MLASSEIKVSAFGYSTEGDAINETIDMNAGDLLIVGGKGPSDFNDLWITVQYDVSNVRIYESESLSETKVLTYVVIGIAALCLIAILVSRRSPLSTKSLESIRPSKPVLGKIFAILVVAVIAGAGAYAYMSCPGNDDVDSLEFREGLTVGRTTYQNGELYMKTVYTLGPVEDGMCYCTVKYYNSSGSEIYSDSDIVSIAEFRLIIGYYGSPSELIDLADDDDFETARETVDSGIGTVRCDKYIVTDELSTQTMYVYHGMVLRTVTEIDDDVITTDLTKIEYA